jgi:hypothetical protein
MKEFMLLFNADYKKMLPNSPEAWKNSAKKWNDWIEGIKAQGKWGAPGQQLGQESRIIRPDNLVTDGPYPEIKERLISYCTVKAETIDDAAELAKNCPVLEAGGNVEVRELVQNNYKKGN